MLSRSKASLLNVRRGASLRLSMTSVPLACQTSRTLYTVPTLDQFILGGGATMAQSSAHVIRVLIAKVGLDGHDRGVKVVARTLRDAGMDVIYTGLHRTPEEVVTSAIQEDVDVLGVSILSGAHMTVFPRILDLLKQNEAEDILLVGGGVMPDEDVVTLHGLGVKAILLQDATPEMIVGTVQRVVAERGPR